MRIIITESKLNQAVIDQLNEMYDFDNINVEYGYDDYGNEDDNSIHFYVGDYDYDDSETVFRWYSEDYWCGDNPEDYGWDCKQMKDKSPLLQFENSNNLIALNGYFGDKWKQPFIQLFKDKFNIDIKTIQ